MPWVKLDDGILQHPKMAAVGGLAFAVHVAGIVYCSQNLTDGFVPYGVARTILNLDGLAWVNGMTGDDLEPLYIIRNGMPAYQSLEELDLWEWDGERRGWWIHDYLEYNPSREATEELRAQRREAGSRGGKQKAANSVASDVAKPKQTDSRPLPRTRTPSLELTREFDGWWSKYPRKVGKAKALEQFIQRRKDGTTLEVLTAARDAYASRLNGSAERFILHGSTFLAKDGRWSDDWTDHAAIDDWMNPR